MILRGFESERTYAVVSNRASYTGRPGFEYLVEDRSYSRVLRGFFSHLHENYDTVT
jgi:hypothetical protein